MKVTMDVNSPGLRPAGNVFQRPSGGAENRTVQPDTEIASDVIIKMQKERSLIDALALAQTSRALVQKAINISSRLMSLASEAMRTGRVDINELNSQISSIQGTMINYGENITIPVGNSVSADDLQLKMDNTLVKLRDTATDIISGRPVGNNIKSITTGLNQIASEYDIKIKNYTSQFRNVKQAETTGINYQALNKKTAEFLLNSPSMALMSQGNINNEIAGKLTMG